VSLAGGVRWDLLWAAVLQCGHRCPAIAVRPSPTACSRWERRLGVTGEPKRENGGGFGDFPGMLAVCEHPSNSHLHAEINRSPFGC
jgi:hypothetical protein